MKLNTASYQGVIGALVEETELLSYSIQQKFNDPATAIITLSDPDGSLLQKYRAIPTVQCVAKDNAVYTTETTAGNNNTLDDMHLMPADMGGATVDAYFFGFDAQVTGLRLFVSQAAVLVNPGFAITWKYSQGGGAYADLAGVSDGSDRFTIAGASSITWTIPGDWATDTVNGITGKYWVQAYVSISSAFTTPPLGARASSGVYLGPGRIQIEDPTGTPIFDGRIARAEYDTEKHRLLLIAYDWLDQLDEEPIDYDMREDLDPLDTQGLQGLRESVAHADTNDNSTITAPSYTNGANYYMYDGRMHWPADRFNGKYLVFPNSMAGNITTTVGPEAASENISADGTYPDWEYSAWDADNTCDHLDDDISCWLEYFFRLDLLNTGNVLLSSIDGGKITVSYTFVDDDAGQTAYGFIKTWLYGVGWATLGPLQLSAQLRTDTFTLTKEQAAHIADANGQAIIIFEVWRAHIHQVFVHMYIDQCVITLNATTMGYSSAVGITDTLVLGNSAGEENCLKLDTDLCTDAHRIWEGVPYCIAKPICQHIDTASGALVSDGDVLKTLTCSAAVEGTTGVSTRHYSDRTRFEIMQDLAKMDRASFWITLGGVVVNWKQTFNDGAPTALTDASVLQWGVRDDYHAMRNNCRAYGIRIGNNQLISDSGDLVPDPGAISKCIYGTTRGEIISNAGTMSEQDTKALAGIVAARDNAPPLFLNAKFGGLSTLKLGSEVAITSTLLGLTSAYYVVSKWTYSSAEYRTEIELTPRSSVGFTERFEFADRFRQIAEKTETGERDAYHPELYTETW